MMNAKTKQQRQLMMKPNQANERSKLPICGKENQLDNCEPKFCFECNKSLDKSRHLIKLADNAHSWHPECFKCNVCHHRLDKETSCHTYKDKIVCHDDYAKLQRDYSIKCSRCNWPIGASDWVRRAGRYVYHLACFSCDICLRQLSTGEQFAINTIQDKDMVKLLCRLHFAIEDVNLPAGLSTSTTDKVSNGGSSRSSISSNSSGSHQVETSQAPATSSKLNLSPPLAPRDFTYCSSSADTGHQHQMVASKQLVTGGSQIEAHDEPLDFGSTSSASISRQANQNQAPGQLTQQLEDHGCSTLLRADMSGSSSNGSTIGGQVGNMQSKSKRVRTTFTEDQLAILQTHFQHDSNPDGSDLERIATITGLSKRVTQVWFQNSRARQKKYMIKRKPGPIQVSNLASSTQFSGPNQSKSPGVSNQNHMELPHQQQLQMSSQGMDGRDRKWSNISEPSELSIDAREDDFYDSKDSSEALMMLSEDSTEEA